MVKIKCAVKDKNTLLSKTNDLENDISSIRNNYYNISVPNDFGNSSKLSYIDDLFSDIKSDAKLINDSLEKYLYKLDDIQADLLDVVSKLSVESLLLFNNEWLDKN